MLRISAGSSAPHLLVAISAVLCIALVSSQSTGYGDDYMDLLSVSASASLDGFTHFNNGNLLYSADACNKGYSPGVYIEPNSADLGKRDVSLTSLIDFRPARSFLVDDPRIPGLPVGTVELTFTSCEHAFIGGNEPKVYLEGENLDRNGWPVDTSVGYPRYLISEHSTGDGFRSWSLEDTDYYLALGETIVGEDVAQYHKAAISLFHEESGYYALLLWHSVEIGVHINASMAAAPTMQALLDIGGPDVTPYYVNSFEHGVDPHVTSYGDSPNENSLYPIGVSYDSSLETCQHDYALGLFADAVDHEPAAEFRFADLPAHQVVQVIFDVWFLTASDASRDSIHVAVFGADSLPTDQVYFSVATMSGIPADLARADMESVISPPGCGGDEYLVSRHVTVELQHGEQSLVVTIGAHTDPATPSVGEPLKILIDDVFIGHAPASPGGGGDDDDDDDDAGGGGVDDGGNSGGSSSSPLSTTVLVVASAVGGIAVIGAVVFALRSSSSGGGVAAAAPAATPPAKPAVLSDPPAAKSKGQRRAATSKPAAAAPAASPAPPLPLLSPPASAAAVSSGSSGRRSNGRRSGGRRSSSQVGSGNGSAGRRRKSSKQRVKPAAGSSPRRESRKRSTAGGKKKRSPKPQHNRVSMATTATSATMATSGTAISRYGFADDYGDGAQPADGLLEMEHRAAKAAAGQDKRTTMASSATMMTSATMATSGTAISRYGFADDYGDGSQPADGLLEMERRAAQRARHSTDEA